MSESTNTELTPSTSQQSAKHGWREDEQLKHETAGLVQGGHSSRAEEWRDPEPAGEDQPTGDVGIVPEDRRGTPPGMTSADVEHRSLIARHLGTSAFPGDRARLIDLAEANHAPDSVMADLTRLPADEEFATMQDVARTLGIGVEDHRV